MAEQLIELGIHRTGRTNVLPTSITSKICDLIAAISTFPIESEALDTEEFRGELARYGKMVSDASSPTEIAEAVELCIAACEDYERRSRNYLLDRESEFKEVIKVLRGAVIELSGDAQEFHTKLLTTSERMESLMEIDDLRDLKRQISEEVSELKRAVAEKKRTDAATYSSLSRKIEGLQTRLERVKEESMLDPVTRVANRRGFEREVEAWVRSCTQQNKSFALAIIDVDDFKSINDQHGHPIGDRVLLCAAQSLKQTIRPTDFVARYGGDEFVLLLDEAKLKTTESRFVVLVDQIAAASYEYEKCGVRSQLKFSVSCGIAEYEPGEEVVSLLARADEALYDAKKKGKNRVVARKKSFFNSLFGAGVRRNVEPQPSQPPL